MKPKIDVSEKAKDVVITFGKYSGMTLGDIYKENPGYIEWLAIECSNYLIHKKANELLKELQD